LSNLLVETGNCASRTTAMINKYYKEAGVPSEVADDGTRVTLPDYDFPALASTASEQVSVFSGSTVTLADSGVIRQAHHGRSACPGPTGYNAGIPTEPPLLPPELFDSYDSFFPHAVRQHR
jgi:hypothetical protein